MSIKDLSPATEFNELRVSNQLNIETTTNGFGPTDDASIQVAPNAVLPIIHEDNISTTGATWSVQVTGSGVYILNLDADPASLTGPLQVFITSNVLNARADVWYDVTVLVRGDGVNDWYGALDASSNPWYIDFSTSNTGLQYVSYTTSDSVLAQQTGGIFCPQMSGEAYMRVLLNSINAKTLLLYAHV